MSQSSPCLTKDSRDMQVGRTWTVQPALSQEVCSAHTIPGTLWDCPSWAQTPNRAKARVTGREEAEGPDRAQLEDGPAGTGDHIETHRTCKHSKPLSHGMTRP